MFVRRSGWLNQSSNSNENSNSVIRRNFMDKSKNNLVAEPGIQNQIKEEKQTKEKDCQQHRYFNSPQIQQLIQDMNESNNVKKESDEMVQVTESHKNISATTKALEVMEIDKKRLKKAKIPTALKRKKLNHQLSKLLMPKSALILLHEFKPGCQYKVQSQKGCIPPTFIAQVEYENEVLGTGQGLSKAQAKNSAAEDAIKTIVSRTMSKSLSKAQTEFEEGEANMEEDEDTPENLPWTGLASFAIYKMFSEWQSQGTDLLAITRPVAKPKSKVPNLSSAPKRELPPNAAELHPAVVLNMMHQGLTAVEIEREDGPNCRVKMGYSIDGKMFTGVGRNKKDARKEAAKAVLEGLHGLTYPC